jgi:ATP/maltotriose-dependent transcriptional regulator MalT
MGTNALNGQIHALPVKEGHKQCYAIKGKEHGNCVVAAGQASPERLPGIATFARLFFRELFERLDRPLLLVLDNYQTVPKEDSLHDLIRIALEEVPERCSTLVLSRLPPLTRLQVNGELCLVDAAELRMDGGESAELSRLRGKGAIDESDARTLIERSQGWAAGLNAVELRSGVS